MTISKPFVDRSAAGRALAKALASKKLVDPVVLALPRGGVPVAAEIAKALSAPLDVVLVRKIGVPYQRELAVAAVVDGDQPEVVVNEDVARHADLPPGYIEAHVKQELEEIERRREVYLQGQERVPLEGRTLIPRGRRHRDRRQRPRGLEGAQEKEAKGPGARHSRGSDRDPR